MFGTEYAANTGFQWYFDETIIDDVFCELFVWYSIQQLYVNALLLWYAYVDLFASIK